MSQQGAQKVDLDQQPKKTVERLQPAEESVGALFKKARTSIGEELKETAQELRISERYLKAIEENNFDALPERVYTLGFVRTYAKHLGLSQDAMIVKFKECIDLTTKNPKLEFPAPVPASNIPKGSMAAVAFAMALFVGIIWYVLHDTPAAEVEADAAEFLADIRFDEPVLPSKQIESEEIVSTSEMATVNDTELLSAKDAPQEQEIVSINSFKLLKDMPFTIIAHGDAWLEVRDGNGHVLVSRQFSNGDRQGLRARTSMKLTTNNAGVITLMTDTQATDVLGKPNERLEDYPLPVLKQ
jgi:hypothetical protein